ncbi:PKD domain-containing protein [Taibaiella lutea]|uniref:PKD domain-containing protein n=1 Tax=Taibaiella lutea TaxID=2608001 RepID=A0A5M6CQE0_9BACT|nr:PKD domain-containing protein [Taibaiella lutea]KAA5536192.1 PKD domain-containing protein [Taibaiella lutea]
MGGKARHLPTPATQFTYTNSDNVYNFNYTGSNPYTSIGWDFGDNTPGSNNPNPTHTYTASGSYIVCTHICHTGTYWVFIMNCIYF